MEGLSRLAVAVCSAGDPLPKRRKREAPPPRGVKRALSARVPPSASKRARVERLRAVLPSVTGALVASSLVSLSIGGVPLQLTTLGAGVLIWGHLPSIGGV